MEVKTRDNIKFQDAHGLKHPFRLLQNGENGRSSTLKTTVARMSFSQVEGGRLSDAPMDSLKLYHALTREPLLSEPIAASRCHHGSTCSSHSYTKKTSLWLYQLPRVWLGMLRFHSFTPVLKARPKIHVEHKHRRRREIRTSSPRRLALMQHPYTTRISTTLPCEWSASV
jgi:hypothetical protein